VTSDSAPWGSVVEVRLHNPALDQDVAPDDHPRRLHALHLDRPEITPLCASAEGTLLPTFEPWVGTVQPGVAVCSICLASVPSPGWRLPNPRFTDRSVVGDTTQWSYTASPGLRWALVAYFPITLGLTNCRSRWCNRDTEIWKTFPYVESDRPL
jgi:hypothetical protein